VKSSRNNLVFTRIKRETLRFSPMNSALNESLLSGLKNKAFRRAFA
jgi:hypothetical protein